jgi:hypothetical protein
MERKQRGSAASEQSEKHACCDLTLERHPLRGGVRSNWQALFQLATALTLPRCSCARMPCSRRAHNGDPCAPGLEEGDDLGAAARGSDDQHVLGVAQDGVVEQNAEEHEAQRHHLRTTSGLGTGGRASAGLQKPAQAGPGVATEKSPGPQRKALLVLPLTRAAPWRARWCKRGHAFLRVVIDTPRILDSDDAAWATGVRTPARAATLERRPALARSVTLD